MPVIACKLPTGLAIKHNGATIVLAGANVGEDLENVARNGRPNDNARRASGFGLTEITAEQAETFTDWANKMQYEGGKPGAKKLANPFPALDNGSILGPFKSMDDARKECNSLSGAVATGFEGLDPAKEGTAAVKIEENTDAKD